MSLFRKDDDAVFDNLCKISKDPNLISNIRSTDAILITQEMIDTILKISEEKTLTINMFNNIAYLMNSNIFKEYHTCVEEETMKQCEKFLEPYFDAICSIKGVSSSYTQIRIYSLLKMNVQIPTQTFPINFNNAQVNMSTTYKPTAYKEISTFCDIESVVTNAFYKDVSEQDEIKFVKNNFYHEFDFKGPILQSLVNSSFQLQHLVLQNARSMGIAANSWVNNTNALKRKYKD